MILSFHRNLRDTDIVSLQYRGITIIPRNRPALVSPTLAVSIYIGALTSFILQLLYVADTSGAPEQR